MSNIPQVKALQPWPTLNAPKNTTAQTSKDLAPHPEHDPQHGGAYRSANLQDETTRAQAAYRPLPTAFINLDFPHSDHFVRGKNPQVKLAFLREFLSRGLSFDMSYYRHTTTGNQKGRIVQAKLESYLENLPRAKR